MENTGIKKYELEEYLPLIFIKEKNKAENTISEELKDITELNRLEYMLREDFDEIELGNISEEKIKREVKRYRKIVKILKQIYGCKCQLCKQTFLMDNGDYYCEAHHIIPLSENGNQDSDNVILLCPNHHRMFHYAKNRITIGELINKKRIIYIDDARYEVDFERDSRVYKDIITQEEFDNKSQ